MDQISKLQLVNFLYACGLGVWIGLYYELFRTWRLLFVPSVIGCFLQDIFFCITSALITFFVFLGIADGQLYPYLLIGELTGFCSFYFTMGRLCHRVLGTVIRGIFLFVRGIRRKVYAVLRILFSGVQSKFLVFYREAVKKIGERRKKSKKISKKS